MPWRRENERQPLAGIFDGQTNLQNLGDAWAIGLTLKHLQALAEAAARHDPAVMQVLASLALRRELNEKWSLATPLHSLVGHAGSPQVPAPTGRTSGPLRGWTLSLPCDGSERLHGTHPVTLRTTVPAQEASEPSLAICLLGGFKLAWCDAVAADETWGRPRAMAIFQYFVLHRDRVVSPDELADVFWPGARSVQETSLYTMLSRVRRALRHFAGSAGSRWLAKAHGGYRLVPPPAVWIDVEVFQRALLGATTAEGAGRALAALGHLEEALSLYKGDLLIDAPYSSWCAPRREGLRQQFLDAAIRLAKIRESGGEFCRAIDVYRCALDHDSSLEEAHQGLIRCYAATGRRGLALRQYQECVRSLRTHVDVDPSDETIALYRTINRCDLT